MKRRRKPGQKDPVKGKVVYMKVSADKYRLPEVVADGPAELARKIGMKPNTVSSMISHGRGTCIRVELEEDEEDDN